MTAQTVFLQQQGLDARVFGPAEPAASEAESYWRAVDEERRTLSAGVSRRRRLRGALSLRTFWRR